MGLDAYFERLYRRIDDVETDVEAEFEAINTIGGKSWCTDGDIYVHHGHVISHQPYESTCLYVVNALGRNYYDLVDADMLLFVRNRDVWTC